VLFEGDAVFGGFVAPPGRYDVEGEASVADVVDVGGVFGEQGGVVEGGSYGDHQLLLCSDSGQGGGCGPGVEGGGLFAFDIIEIELGDEGEVEADLFAADGELFYIVPGGGHVLFFYVAQPAAEDGHPVSVSHVILI